MKKIALTMLIVCTFLAGYSQITIKSASVQITEHQFDSTKNLNYDDPSANIGQTIFFLPWKTGERLFQQDTTMIYPHVLFRIIDKKPIWRISTVAGKYFKIMSIIPANFKYGDKLYYTCVDTRNDSDTVYYYIGKMDAYFKRFNDAPFISIAYFEHEKGKIGRKYQNPYATTKPIYDINTGKQVTLIEKEILECIDITILEVTDNNWLQPSYIMKTDDGKQFAIPFNRFGADPSAQLKIGSFKEL